MNWDFSLVFLVTRTESVFWTACCKARYAVLFLIRTFPPEPEDEAHIGPTATYDKAICPGFPTRYHNITDTRIQHLIQAAYNCLKYNTTAEDKCLSTDYKQMPTGKEKNIDPITTWVQALRRDPPN